MLWGGIAEIAAAQRYENARRTTATLGVLNAVAVVTVVALGPRHPAVVALLSFTALGQASAYFLVKTGHSTLGAFGSAIVLYIEQIGVVGITGELGPIPYIVSLVILLVAATAEARWLPFAFASCLAAIGIEAWLSPWSYADRGATVAATLFATAVFVVSQLHARGTARAFELAERREEARASAAAAAVQSEQRYRLIADGTQDLISLVDPLGRALYLSPSHERCLGLPVEQMLGRNIAECQSLVNPKTATEAFERSLLGGQESIEVQLRIATGELRTLEASMKRVDEGSDIMVAVISRDITERKALETRLRASERLEALGRLAGGVAHDFNNLLTVIGAAADLTRTVLPNEHPAVADVEAILDATRTAADLSRQLLTFSRKEVLLQDNINVAAVLGAQRNVLARLVGQSIVLEYDFEAHLPEVLTQASRVEQLAMNLAANARDAMSEGGRLNFSLRQREILRHEVEDLPAGLYLELKVRDQGAGIPNDILPHLFEPFFSTKGPRGTGLGLATCFGIVQQAGGSITVQSQLGIGTTFTVLLPAAHAEHNAIPLSNEATLVRTVLLVDDDPNVLQTTARMLRSEQFEVFTASTLAEARCILEDKDIVLGAMLTDVVLGEELGTDLLEPCRRLRPLTRIIVTSGYAPDGNPSEQVSAYRTVFVPKPFSREQLINAFG